MYRRETKTVGTTCFMRTVHRVFFRGAWSHRNAPNLHHTNPTPRLDCVAVFAIDPIVPFLSGSVTFDLPFLLAFSSLSLAINHSFLISCAPAPTHTFLPSKYNFSLLASLHLLQPQCHMRLCFPPFLVSPNPFQQHFVFCFRFDLAGFKVGTTMGMRIVSFG
jgi:hypothetical protein